MKIALIKERKNPPDRRVVLPPEICQQLIVQYPEVEIKIRASDIRCYSDEEYRNAGFDVVDDVTDCDVLLGVKEVPIEALIPNKSYFFFSHTIKKQAYNRQLLRAILDKNITFYDHETVTNNNNIRLIGFGYYAGVVGAYNAIRTYGLKHNLYAIPKVKTLEDKAELIEVLSNIELPKIKILITGKGRVGNAIKEILDAVNIKEVSVDDYLSKTYDEIVYTQTDVLDYNKRKDGRQLGINDFFNNPEDYKSDFLKYSKVTDLYIAGHFHNKAAPDFFTKEDVADPEFKISVIADISCDIGHPIPTTLRASTIADPVYGYNKMTGKEDDYNSPESIAIMAIDNLPTSLPKDASMGFGKMFLEHVIPAFYNGDKDGILHRAKITENGQLTERFKYLQDYVDGQ